jgi:DNA-binding PadR family transcriptional regulator
MKLENIKRIEGRQTIESVVEALGIGRQSAINLISKLKKEGYAAASGGGRQKRIYTISTKVQRHRRYRGMFDILNEYAKDKIVPHFLHEPHFNYSVENAIADLIELDDLRITINILPLFNHVQDWSLLYKLAKDKKEIKMIGALYDVAKMTTKVRKMPQRFRKYFLDSAKSTKEKDFLRSSHDFLEIERIWKVKIPFNRKDLEVYR